MQRSRTYYLLMGIPALVMASWSIISIIQNQVDIPHHLDCIMRWHEGDPEARLYSLYFHVINLLTLFSYHRTAMEAAAVAVLTAMVIFKFVISDRIIVKYVYPSLYNPARYRFLIHTSVIAMFLCLCQNLIYKFSATMALGYIPVNTWHNSTTIALMPVALLAFFKSYDFIVSKPDSFFNKEAAALMLLTVLSVLIKPSFFFVLVTAFPLFFFLNHRFCRSLVAVILICMAGMAALLLIKHYVYSGSGSQVVIKPFEAWKIWSTNIPLSLLASIAFPVTVLLLYSRKIIKDKLMQYAWLSFVSGLVVYILLNESGERAIHGNFSWQTIVFNFILFLSTIIFLLKQKTDLKSKMAFTVFAIHVAAGIVFIAKMPFFGPR